jgi:hypothetical protein
MISVFQRKSVFKRNSVLPYSVCGTRPTTFFDMKCVKTKDGSEDSIVLQIQTLVRVPEFYRIPEVYRIPVFYGILYFWNTSILWNTIFHGIQYSIEYYSIQYNTGNSISVEYNTANSVFRPPLVVTRISATDSDVNIVNVVHAKCRQRVPESVPCPVSVSGSKLIPTRD